jgi:hypothetical protein
MAPVSTRDTIRKRVGALSKAEANRWDMYASKVLNCDPFVFDDPLKYYTKLTGCNLSGCQPAGIPSQLFPQDIGENERCHDSGV